MAVAGSSITFVHLGEALPPWSIDAMTQASFFNSCPIYMVANAGALAGTRLPPGVEGVASEDVGISDHHRTLLEVTPFDRDFRGGFWMHAIQRFFVLESALRMLGLNSTFHMENDVLLYADLDVLAPKLQALYPGVATTFDHDQRGIPSVMYVGSLLALAVFTRFMTAVMETVRGAPPGETPTDMLLLSIWRRTRKPEEMDAMPVVPNDYPAPLRNLAGDQPADPSVYSRHFQSLGMVFDAAALGQYLGGIDPRNDPRPSKGFINETAYYDPRILKPRMVVGDDGLKRPMIETPGGLCPMANLHVHSKNLREFMSR